LIIFCIGRQGIDQRRIQTLDKPVQTLQRKTEYRSKKDIDSGQASVVFCNGRRDIDCQGDIGLGQAGAALSHSLVVGRKTAYRPRGKDDGQARRRGGVFQGAIASTLEEDGV
jgi:hypothetical protein